jgi:hypothetical protein
VSGCQRNSHKHIEHSRAEQGKQWQQSVHCFPLRIFALFRKLPLFSFFRILFVPLGSNLSSAIHTKEKGIWKKRRLPRWKRPKAEKFQRQLSPAQCSTCLKQNKHLLGLADARKNFAKIL